MRIRLVDLKRQYTSIKDEIDAAIGHCIDETRFIGGESVETFSNQFAAYCNIPYCTTCGNGTDALEIVLQGLEIGRGDEVIVPAFTFFASVEAVVNVGALPVLADIDPVRYTISPKEIEKHITPRTKAVIVVHLYGQMGDMDPIMELAEKKGIFVIEDAAQAHGATYKGKRAGSLGVAGTFSFYPGKNLGAYGDAGAIVMADKSLHEKTTRIANHGRMTKYNHEIFGRNSRMDSIQASILNVKLKYIDKWNQDRRKIAALYMELLSGVDGLAIPHEYEDAPSVYHLFVVRVAADIRKVFMEYLRKHGIDTGIHYPISISKVRAMRKLDINQRDYPVANAYMAEVVSLPIFPELTEQEVYNIVESIISFTKSTKSHTID